MKTTRRKILGTALKAGAILPFASAALFSCSDQPIPESEEEAPTIKPLKILILGGTSFLGPHQIAYALERGHAVSTFTRGKTKATVHEELFERVESLVGDRNDDLSALENREWDVVIDNSGRNEAWTKATAELLKDSVKYYLYTSSTGVYYPYLTDDIKEDTPLVTAIPEGTEDEDELMEYGYGVMKTLSEQAATAAFGADRTIIVRPTYMVGPADKTNRFIHWPIRLSRGGETLVPGKADDPVQYLDVRDVAEFMIRLAEEGKVGAYNAVGPSERETMREFVTRASVAFPVDTIPVYVDDYEFLKEQGVYYLVPWIPVEGNNYGSSQASNALAKANGLTFRPLVDTMRETLQWWKSDAVSDEIRSKVEGDEKNILQREGEVIAAWKERKEVMG